MSEVKLPEIKPIYKPGWRTTEFWLSLLAIVVGAVYSSGLLIEGSTADQIVGLAVVVLSALGYQYSRTQVKK